MDYIAYIDFTDTIIDMDCGEKSFQDLSQIYLRLINTIVNSFRFYQEDSKMVEYFPTNHKKQAKLR